MPDDFELLTLDKDFDPMAVLHGAQQLKKPSEEAPNQQGAKAPEETPTTTTRQVIDLSDEMLEQGFTQARKTSSQNAGGPTGKKPDADAGDTSDPTDTGKKEKPNPAPLTADEKNNAYTTHYKMMVATGAWEEIEDFDGSEEKYLEAAELNDEKKIHGKLDGYFEEAFAKNPSGRDMGVRLFRHLQAGGTVEDFQQIYSPSEFRFEDIESEDEEVAEEASKTVIRNYYNAIGWKKAKVDDLITNLSKTGRVVEGAKMVTEPYQDLLKVQQDRYQEKLEQSKYQAQLHQKKVTDAIVSMIKENKGFGAVKLYENRKEQQQLTDFFFQPDEETGKTAYSIAFNEALRDPEFLTFIGVSLFKGLHKHPEKLIDSAKAESKATSKLASLLEGSLLNKDIGSRNQENTAVSKPQTGSSYKFDLDNVRVISS
jgi:hypothetical protein